MFGSVRASLVSVALCGGLFAQSPIERAVTLARENRYAESGRILQRIAEPADAPPRLAFHRLKAANASGIGDNAAALRGMLLALQLAPSDPSLLVGTAMLEFQANRLDDALQHAEKAGAN